MKRKYVLALVKGFARGTVKVAKVSGRVFRKHIEPRLAQGFENMYGKRR